MGLHETATRLIESSHAGLDLTDATQLAAVDEATGELLATGGSATQLAELEVELAGRGDAVPLKVHLALKLARSRRWVESIDDPLRVSVVFAMYKEHQRILERAQHPHGEDFLARKVQQLERLFRDRPAVQWKLIAVDDGCPEGSGRIAAELVQRHGLSDRVEVLFLQQAIDAGVPVTAPMQSAAESQKGGSVVYGMWQAAQQPHDNHVVLFTDADLSTHLGQVGLLLEPIVQGGHDVAVGSRRERTSIVVKKGVRNTRGKLFIYLWKGVLGPLSAQIDTQCGFKAFRAELLRAIAEDVNERRFAVDLELMLRAELRRAGCIAKVPIAWIDSEAASTTTDLQPYLAMLHTAANLYRQLLPTEPESDAFAELILSLDEAAWQRMVAHMPAAIAEGDPRRFSTERPVSASELATAARAS